MFRKSVALSPLSGLMMMAVAMFLIPIVDGMIKFLIASHSPLYLGWIRYVAASVFIVPIAYLKFGIKCFPEEAIGAQFLRTVFLVTAMIFFFVALSHIELALATIAYFTAPIISGILAVFILKERLTMYKIIALLLGFLGAVIILNPTAEFELGVILAMTSGLFFSFYIIATRKASKSSPLKTLVFQSVVGTILLTPFAVFTWSVPDGSEMGFIIAIGLVSVVSHFMSISAFKFAEASVLAPLIYLELVGAVFIGYFIFSETLDVNEWIGAGIIVTSGLLLVYNARRSL